MPMVGTVLSRRLRQDVAASLVVEEPEDLVFAIQHVRDENRAPGREAEEVLVIGGNGLGNAIQVIEEIVGVQIVVAHVLPQVAVQAVGARFDGRIDDAAGGVAEFGVEIAALQREFLDGVRRRNDGGIGPGVVAAIELDVVVNAVEAEIVLPIFAPFTLK